MASSLVFDILARDRASATFAKIGKSAQKTTGGIDKLKVAFYGLGITAGAALLKVGRDSVRAFTEAEDAQTRLQDAFDRFPQIADTNVESINAIATALQKKTKADDEAVKSGAAVLAQFVDSGRQLEDLTPLVVDYAQKTGRDIPTAAKNVGRAFLGNTRALKELGISYKMTGDRAIDVANITDLLRQKVGGFAEREGKTAAGQAAILSNQFEELEEVVGSHLVPALLTLVKAGIATAGFIQRNKDVIVPLTAAIGGVIVATKAWTAAQLLLNAALLANPVGAFVAGTALMVASLVILYKKSEQARKVFKDVGISALGMAQVFLTAARFMMVTWTSVVGAIIHGAAKAFGWVPGLGPKLEAADRAFNEFKNNTVAALDKAAKEAADLERQLRGLPTHGSFVYTIHVVGAAALNSVGSAAGRARIESRQHGGPLRPGRSYLFEGRPEIITMGRAQSGQVTPVTPSRGGGKVDLSDRTINKLAQVLLAGIRAGGVQSARASDLYARAG